MSGNSADQPVPDPWERQPRETVKAFQAFALYRDLGVGERSIREVARQLGKSATLISRWSSRWDWVDRVGSWEAEIDRVRRRANLTALGEMASRQAQLGVALQGKAVEALGKVTTDKLVAAPNLLTQMAKIGAEVERRARFGLVEADARERESRTPRNVSFIFEDVEPADIPAEEPGDDPDDVPRETSSQDPPEEDFDGNDALDEPDP